MPFNFKVNSEPPPPSHKSPPSDSGSEPGTGVVLGPLLLCLTLICIDISRKLADPIDGHHSPQGTLQGTPQPSYTAAPHGAGGASYGKLLVAKRDTPRTGGGPHHTPVPGFGARSRRQQHEATAPSALAAA